MQSNDKLESFVIHMFRKGVTMAEIADLIEKMCGSHYTRQTISNMKQVMEEQVEAFNMRELSSRYFCIYLDAKHISVRRETFSKEAIYQAVDILEDGSKEVITYTRVPTEFAFTWKEILLEIKEYSVEEVLLFLPGGLTGMVETIASVFPKAKFQTCLVHVARTISHKVRVEDQAEICEGFKTVYRADDLVEGQTELDEFCSK